MTLQRRIYYKNLYQQPVGSSRKMRKFPSTNNRNRSGNPDVSSGIFFSIPEARVYSHNKPRF